jgi:hypothetical protein
MKSSLSFAVLLLIENVSSSEVHRHHHRPQNNNYLQKGSIIQNRLRGNLDDKTYLSYDHENDTEDLSEMVDPIN